MWAVLLANAADLLTFLLAASVLPIEGEGNPLARQLYSAFGPWGVVLLKVAGVLIILAVLSGRPESTAKAIAVAILVALPLLGALTNLTAVALTRS